MNRLNNKRGAVQALVAIAMVVILGAAALVVDVGVSMGKRMNLSNGLDAAALAGGMELPAHPDLAVTTVQQYLQSNSIDPASVQISITQGNRKLKLIGTEVVNTSFARVLGINTTTISADATVIVGAASAVYGGTRPLAIADQPLIYGQSVVLKEGGGDGSNGNYGAVSFFGDRGAAIFKEYLLNGYPGSIAVGDIIQTEPGNMASSIDTVRTVIARDPAATPDDFSRSSPRVWTIPVLETLNVSGRADVKVVGFAQFFIEDIALDLNGKAEITGRFVQFVTNADVNLNQTDYGLYGVRLVSTD